VVGELVALASSLVALASSLLAGELVALGTMVATLVLVQPCLRQWVVVLPSIWDLPLCASVLMALLRSTRSLLEFFFVKRKKKNKNNKKNDRSCSSLILPRECFAESLGECRR